MRPTVYRCCIIALAMLITSCAVDGTSSATGNGIPAMMRVVAGSTQIAKVNSRLPQAIRFLVTDESGNPVPGVHVQVEVVDGEGDIAVPDQTTRADGTVSITWTLGPMNGVQTIEARQGNLDPVVVNATATGCDAPECPEYDISSDVPDEMFLPTYDLSSQVVHPDVALRPGATPWYWLTVTPYPNGNARFENPSVYRSINGKFWRTPKGLVNPVAWPMDGHLSDPDLVFDEASESFWLFYRLVTPTRNIILVKRSRDGIKWGPQDTVVSAPNHAVVSPAVVRGAPHAPWQMWSVDAGTQGCSSKDNTIWRRTSEDGLHWSEERRVQLWHPGKLIWHLDVNWVAARNEYWALYTTYDLTKSCATTELYLATSPDGTAWTFPTAPIYRAGTNPIFRDVVYRSTFLTSPDGAWTTLWISGANYANNAYRWSAATVRWRTEELLRISRGTPPATLFNFGGPVLPPPEPWDMPRN